MSNKLPQNIALLIEYCGRSFAGFQKQKDFPSIQEHLEVALSRFANQNIEIITAGRTDAGVHALGQVVNFITTARRELSSWVRGVNALLPSGIAVKKAAYVADKFNARFNAISRTYHYYLLVSPTRPSVLDGKVGWYYKHLDLKLMQDACQLLLGEHDFSSFRASSCQALTPVRNMLVAEVKEVDSFLIADPTLARQKIIRFEFTANAFLYHMVRNLVGALLYVGNNKLTLSEFSDIINQKNRVAAPPTFMPDGLYLHSVKYESPLFK